MLLTPTRLKRTEGMFCAQRNQKLEHQKHNHFNLNDLVKNSSTGVTVTKRVTKPSLIDKIRQGFIKTLESGDGPSIHLEQHIHKHT